MPDYEIIKCKMIFNDMIEKYQDCAEAHFGLGKLLAHEGKYDHSLHQFQAAQKLKPDDVLYKTWLGLAHYLTPRISKREAAEIVGSIPDLTIEKWWILMEIALTGELHVGVEVEDPRYYAT
jgi:tetratricopeptide (TPR) repeat protein